MFINQKFGAGPCRACPHQSPPTLLSGKVQSTYRVDIFIFRILGLSQCPDVARNDWQHYNRRLLTNGRPTADRKRRSRRTVTFRATVNIVHGVIILVNKIKSCEYLENGQYLSSMLFHEVR